MSLTIDPVKVKQAAEQCPAAAETLKTLFPEVFEAPKPFEFGETFVLKNGHQGPLCPLFIGKFLPPSHLMNKCLVVSEYWEMKTEKYGGSTILSFYHKTNQ